MKSGLTKLDFGDSGASDASVFVRVPEVEADTRVFAWLYPKATDDHSVDEHIVTPIRVIASQCTEGSGFTVYGFYEFQNYNGSLVPTVTGQWFVAWAY